MYQDTHASRTGVYQDTHASRTDVYQDTRGCVSGHTCVQDGCVSGQDLVHRIEGVSLCRHAVCLSVKLSKQIFWKSYVHTNAQSDQCIM